jgi:uncharacterized protein (TIGR02996 family)
VTTEDDFQRALDANPDDWQTRLVFADWLQERGDPRAEGYRALAVRRWRAYQPNPGGHWTVANYRADKPTDVSDLPNDWFGHVWDAAPRKNRNPTTKGRWISTNSRRAAEDVAALAFAKLPPKRQTELLAAQPTES